MLFYQIGDDDLDKDSAILDGKKWEEHLDEVIFKKSEKSPFPEQSTNDAMIFGEGHVLITGDGLKYVSPTETPGVIKVDSEIPKENKNLTPIGCSHEWIVYEGAGTKPPETICKTCGNTKKQSS